MKRSATLALLLLMPLAAWAETDLCLFGKDRDVRDWIKDGANFKAISCKKTGPVLKTVKELKASLLRDGYHLIAGPAIQPIPMGPHPTPELLAEIFTRRCGKKPKVVYTVCVTIKENEPLGLTDAKKLADKEPPSAADINSGPTKPRHNEGKTRAN